MPIVHFPSLPEADAAEVELVRLDGTAARKRLLVDSGFTGTSSLVLPPNHISFARAGAVPTTTSGALTGEHRRIAVIWRIPALRYERAGFAILADLSDLSLPPGVDGLAGLRFLRQFQRWGAEMDHRGRWRFFLQT
jgi:hypothetical protein